MTISTYYVFANDGLNVDVIFIDQFKDAEHLKFVELPMALFFVIGRSVVSLAERMLAREAISQRQIGFHASWNWIHP